MNRRGPAGLAGKLRGVITGRAGPGFASGTFWAGGGIVISTLAALLANLVAVAMSPIEAFADLAVLTAVLFLGGTVARLGANQMMVGEINSVRRLGGEAAAWQRGADIIAFVTLTGLAGGALLLLPLVASVLELGLSRPLSVLDRLALSIWFASDVVRLVVSEAHRAKFQFKLAMVAGQGVRAPLFFLAIVGIGIFEGGHLERSHLLWASGAASALVCLCTMATSAVSFRWWRANPFVSAQVLWRGHTSMLITTLSAALIGNADVYIMGASADAETTASYGLAVTLVAGIAVLGVAVTSGLSPFVAAAAADGSLQNIQSRIVTYVRYAAALGAGALTLLVVFVRPVATALGGPGYDDITIFVLILGLGQLIGVMSGLAGSVLIVSRRYRLAALVAGGVCVAGLALELIVASLLNVPVLIAIVSASATGALHVTNALVLYRVTGLRTDALAARKEPP